MMIVHQMDKKKKKSHISSVKDKQKVPKAQWVFSALFFIVFFAHPLDDSRKAISLIYLFFQMSYEITTMLELQL